MSHEDGQSDYDASTMDQRQRLLSGTERLGQSSRRLEDSHRLALETEGIGINILSTLKGQRETMVRARDTVSFFKYKMKEREKERETDMIVCIAR